MKRFASVASAVSGAALVACGTPPPNPLMGSGHPPDYVAGWNDGCSSGKNSQNPVVGFYTKNQKRYDTDKQYAEGTYRCAGCGTELFGSDTKFNSGTGWPSFFRPIDPARIATQVDLKLGVPRTEYRCARCGGHQGHVFDDGPAPTGQRYCNNGVSLLFVPAGQALPPLRD